ncbi:hypothetical protein LEL_08249 [Akanthomyces lecanii RCEF 1005]|uniref:Uncharacterized protein n=1 Tax=Akanthomyces lecanii RCEF 1005 TaxID=1081108 RepID=A0A162KGQ7_CORDF|nr:hypothetical protein LEL_08249 [Akanthomyces lecanii RCEF 1005]
MKAVVIFSAIVGLGLAAPPSNAGSGLQTREDAVGSGCLIFGLCKPLRQRLEKANDPSARKAYDSCKKNPKAVGKICTYADCNAIAGALNLNPAADAAAGGVCATLLG